MYSTVLYFAALLGGLVLVLKGKRHRHWLLLCNAVLAGLCSWYFILSFFAEEALRLECPGFLLFCRSQAFLESSSLFIRAYELVALDPLGWVWSNQLLCLAVCFCAFVHVRRDFGFLRVLGYAAVGFLGAISVALSLFLIDVLVFPQKLKTSPKGIGVVPFLSFLIAFVSILVLPVSVHEQDKTAFACALIVLHLILILGMLAPDCCRVVSHQTLFLTISVFSFVLHVYALIQASHQGLSLQALLDAFWLNNCQTSIASDALFATIALLVYFGRRIQASSLSYVLVLALILSPASVFSYILAFPKRLHKVKD